MAKAEQIITHLVDVFPGVVAERWREDSCLAATRVAINVLELYAIKVVPFPVQVLAYNRQWVERTQTLGRGPVYEEEALEWERAGCWSVGVGFGTDKPKINGWDGHMVAVTETPLLREQLLLDLSLGQASRPERDLLLPAATAMPVLPELLDGRGVLMRQNEAGTMIVYQKHPAPPRWDDTPDWRPNRHDLVELALIHALERKGIRLGPASPLMSSKVKGARVR